LGDFRCSTPRGHRFPPARADGVDVLELEMRAADAGRGVQGHSGTRGLGARGPCVDPGDRTCESTSAPSEDGCRPGRAKGECRPFTRGVNSNRTLSRRGSLSLSSPMAGSAHRAWREPAPAIETDRGGTAKPRREFRCRVRMRLRPPSAKAHQSIAAGSARSRSGTAGPEGRASAICAFRAMRSGTYDVVSWTMRASTWWRSISTVDTGHRGFDRLDRDSKLDERTRARGVLARGRARGLLRADRALCGAEHNAHNHPSGNSEPSEADLAVTKRVVLAGRLLGIDVVDHFVWTREGAWCSILGRDDECVG